MRRYTKKIKNANNYCEYDLKYSPYTEIFDLTSNVQIEDYVNADLTLAIDKLGKLEDIMEKYEIESLEELEELIKDYDDMAKSIVEMGLGIKVEIKG